MHRGQAVQRPATYPPHRRGVFRGPETAPHGRQHAHGGRAARGRGLQLRGARGGRARGEHGEQVEREVRRRALEGGAAAEGEGGADGAGGGLHVDEVVARGGCGLLLLLLLVRARVDRLRGGDGAG